MKSLNEIEEEINLAVKSKFCSEKFIADILLKYGCVLADITDIRSMNTEQEQALIMDGNGFYIIIKFDKITKEYTIGFSEFYNTSVDDVRS